MITGFPANRRGIPPVSSCPFGLPQVLVGVPEGGQDHALVVPVTHLAGDRQRILTRADSVLEPLQLLVRQAKVMQGLTFIITVADRLEDHQRLLVAANSILITTPRASPAVAAPCRVRSPRLRGPAPRRGPARSARGSRGCHHGASRLAPLRGRGGARRNRRARHHG